MAVKTYTWITLWFVLTAPVIFWDAGYCFMRYVLSTSLALPELTEHKVRGL